MSSDSSTEVVIIDYGSQFTQLIARRIREAGVFSRIVSCHENLTSIIKDPPAAFVLSGGPASALEKDAPSLDPAILSAGKPILAICYGMQLITLAFGGELAQSRTREYGPAKMELLANSPLWKNIDKALPSLVWMSHGDQVTKIPPGFTVTGKTESLEIAAMADNDKKIYCLQFHPEVHHSADGFQMLENFLFQVAKIKPVWNMATFADHIVKKLKDQVGKGNVICAISGGVDSSVTAALLNRAVGSQLHCIFVDNGLLRQDEAERVTAMLREHFSLQLKVVDAADIFLERLANIRDPEQKRKIIGHTFIEIFTEEAKKIPDVKFLAQGTLYPDVIESTSPKGPSAVIKSHHNVGGLPRDLKFELVEPLRELFKDEVRILGMELGMPESMVWRQPFPGPGLAIRILGEVTKEKLRILRAADAIIQEELRSSGWAKKIWQGFAVLLPLQTVGVMGDARTYENVIAFRCVDSVDAMTADWTKLPYEILSAISTRIINEVPGINRVVYDISSKPPSTIEWE